MSFAISRIAFAARVPIATRQAGIVISARYNSSTAKHGLPTHPTNQTSITPDGSETPTDEATNAYSPVTSDPKDLPADGPLAAATISGAPIDLQTRTVRIYKPSKPASQSSNFPGQRWKMDWDVMTRRGNWENPLMGWISSADHMQGNHLWFKTKEDAIHFAEKQGYEYYVQEPNTRAFRPKQYAANFTHSAGPLKIIRTK